VERLKAAQPFGQCSTVWFQNIVPSSPTPFLFSLDMLVDFGPITICLTKNRVREMIPDMEWWISPFPTLSELSNFGSPPAELEDLFGIKNSFLRQLTWTKQIKAKTPRQTAWIRASSNPCGLAMNRS
jgi:hypothetical protein